MPKPSILATPWIEMVRAALVAAGDRAIAIDPETGTLTARELIHRVGGAIELLDAAGIRSGDAVPALITMRPASLALVLAGAATNRPLAPLSGRLTVRELAECLEGLECPAVLCEPHWADVGGQLAERCGRELIIVDGVPPMSEAPRLSAATESTAFVLHTSGTTGRPRRVDVRQDRMAARSLRLGRLMRMTPGSVFVAGSPFHHIGGLGAIAVAMAMGVTTVAFPQFSVDAWRNLKTLGVTHAQAIPTILEMLLRADALVLPDLRLLQYGASPIHPDTLRRVQAAMPDVDVINVYGQTEGAPLTCLSPQDHRSAAAGDEVLLKSVGTAVPGVELAIHEPGADGYGEVWARGAHLFLVDEDGWQHTGDQGRLDERGYLFLAGRKSDMIIRGGENVYPLEVEQVLATHPDVVEAAVVGTPDDRLGEAIKAFVVLRDPLTRLDVGALRTFARTMLAGYKVPEHWEFIPALPRNPSGKVVRNRLPR
jgi:acyl-CoA synthetase (AMP-forming)/AMP-acid ligase II